MLTMREFDELNHEKFGCDLNALSDAYNEYFKEAAQVGDGATLHWWTDSDPYTIIRRTPQSLTLQEDKATLDPDWKPDFRAGGFCGMVVNQHEQSYTYEPNPEGRIIVARWSKKEKRFRFHGQYVTAGRRKFYDYNY